MRRRHSRQQIKKLIDKRCFFCEENNYSLLDVHRIIPGSEGGSYRYDTNMLVICSNCHRRVHAGEIVIDRKYKSTVGTIIHYFENGVEYWRREHEKSPLEG